MAKAYPWFRTCKNSWYITIEGRKISLKVQGKENEAEAMKAWHKIAHEGLPKPEVKKKDETVKELIESFLNDSGTRVKANTQAFYERFLLPFSERYGSRKAKDISSKEAHAFAFKPTWGNSTRHDALTVLATAFRWGKVPLEGLRIPPKESKGMDAVIPEADALKIIDDARGDIQFLLRFLWLTGCRPSEAMNLQAEMVDEANSIASMKEHKTMKATKKARLIYLSPEALALLRSQKEKHPSGFLFRTGNGLPYSLNNAVNILWRLNKKLGTKATLYGFRHSYATEGLAKGLPEAHVAELLGHCSTKMLHQHYAHLGAKASLMKEAASKVR